jgi:hypothetical protein
MKRLIFSLVILLLICFTACSEDSPTGPTSPPEVTKVDITNITPSSPATLKFYETASNDRLTITYDYNVIESGGVRIWIKPVSSSGGGTAHYSPSPVYTGSGSKTVTVSVSSNQDSVHISQLEILIRNPSQTETISQTYIDVNYIFTN